MNWLCTLLSIGCTAGTISGAAYVHDGDTIYINRQPIRLFGVDAEELDEPHGIEARDHLRALIGDQTITCYWEGWSHNRKVGKCFGLVRSDGILTINGQMVSDGYALDCFHYSGGQYRPLEPMGARSRLIQKGYCHAGF